MCTKSQINGNSLLEQSELCPHRLRVRVIKTYNRREPPVRLQDITHLERLGVKPITHKTKYCIWSDIDLSASTTKMSTPKNEEKKPTILPKIQTRNEHSISNKDSVIWLLKPTKTLFESKTNIYEFTKQHLCCDLQDQNEITTTITYAGGNKSHAKNFKLKRTLSTTLIDTDNSKKQLFWQNEKINKLLAKSPRTGNGKVNNNKTNAARMGLETTVTEIIGFDNVIKGERYVGGADPKSNIKFFPVYSTSSNSQLSVDDKPKVKKALSKRVRHKAPVERKKLLPNAGTKGKKLIHHQKMASVISSQGNEATSKTTATSSPFMTSESYKNVHKENNQVSYHSPVAFNLTKSTQKKVLRSKALKRN